MPKPQDALVIMAAVGADRRWHWSASASTEANRGAPLLLHSGEAGAAAAEAIAAALTQLWGEATAQHSAD